MVWTSVELVWQQEGKNIATTLKLAVNQKNQQQRVLLWSVHSEPGKYEDLRTWQDAKSKPMNTNLKYAKVLFTDRKKRIQCSIALLPSTFWYSSKTKPLMLKCFQSYIIQSSALCSLKLWYSSFTTASNCNLQDRSIQTTRPSCFWQS